MARFTAVFTITEATDWASGSYFRFDKFRDQIGQNIEWLGQSHAHGGAPGDGATLVAGEVLRIFYYGPAIE